MKQPLLDRFWHKTLNRPYRLHKAFDQGSGLPVVLLHGLGRMGKTWEPLANMLLERNCRAVAFDLLGFGQSPKPIWINYTVDDHARAVINSIEKQHFGTPVILVGHSMGCLISIRIARLRPDLVRHLVLYEMPLYSGLPDKARYRLRLNFYFGVYTRMINYKPTFGERKPGMQQRFAQKILGFNVTRETWKPFIRSLKHTIMEQTTNEDIKHVKVPMDVIYGKKDRVVIRGETKLIFGEDVKNVTAHLIKEKHRITPMASAFIVKRIDAALAGETSREIEQQEPAY